MRSGPGGLKPVGLHRQLAGQGGPLSRVTAPPLFGVWVSPLHMWFDLAVLGVLIAPWQPLTLLLTAPYAVRFARTRSLRGRFPPAKLLAHVAWDTTSLASLMAGSIRHRALVL